jgi:iron complex outermembrane receptor protein
MIRSALHRRLGAIVLAGAALAAFALPAAAQIEEVIVTARKTEERLQDVPLSVTAFTSDTIEELDTRDLLDVSRYTPGFAFERVNRYGVQGGVSRPVIRGMSNILGEGNASVFIDGIPFSDSVLGFPFDVVERIEVIKGPQAAQFGRATFAGAINMVTKKGSNTHDSKVSLRAAEFDDYEGNLLVSGPLIADKLFYMAHARYYDFGGEYENTLDGGKIGGERSNNYNASLEWRPTENFTAILAGGYSEDHDQHAPITLQDRYGNNCHLNTQRQYYCGEVEEQESSTLDIARLNGTEGVNREGTRGSLQLMFELGSFTLTSNSGMFSTDSEYGYDSTYQGATAFGTTTIPNATGIAANRALTDPVRTQSVMRNEIISRDEWSTELRLASARDARWRFMVGGFYYDGERSLREEHFVATAPTVNSGTSLVENQAVFGSIEADFTDRWSATLELRYAEDTIGNIRAADGSQVEYQFDSTAPRVTSSFKLTPDTMLYFNVAQGNKPGVINADPRFPPELQFADEEEAWMYEIGAKNTLLDGRMIMNIAAYYTDWTNQQITGVFSFPTGGTQSFILNAGKSEVKGAELELQMQLTEYLTGGVTYSYADAKFVELNDAEGLNLFGNASMEGKKLPNVPEQQASAWGRIDFPLNDRLNTFMRADASWIDRKYDQIYNLAHTGEAFLINAAFGFETEHWTTSFFVDNLMNDLTPSTVVRYVDQMNLNVVTASNPNPAQVNCGLPANPSPACPTVSTATERGFFFPLARGRQFGVNLSYRF